MHAMIGEDAEAGEGTEQDFYQETDDAALIAGTVLISGTPAYILVDTGASHSFVSAAFVESRGLTSTLRRYALGVRTPLGRYVEVDRICRNLDV